MKLFAVAQWHIELMSIEIHQFQCCDKRLRGVAACSLGMLEWLMLSTSGTTLAGKAAGRQPQGKGNGMGRLVCLSMTE